MSTTTSTGMNTDFQHIGLQQRGHVAVISLRGPDRPNALNYTDLNQVIRAEHRANDAVRGPAVQKEAVQAFLEKCEPRFTGS
ncbi:MAG: hypothetical protein O2913_02710 [Chloroflexi bacterium]|nr:hypothetical protein [Chloroflexota bacterium]